MALVHQLENDIDLADYPEPTEAEWGKVFDDLVRES